MPRGSFWRVRSLEVVRTRKWHRQEERKGTPYCRLIPASQLETFPEPSYPNHSHVETTKMELEEEDTVLGGEHGGSTSPQGVWCSISKTFESRATGLWHPPENAQLHWWHQFKRNMGGVFTYSMQNLRASFSLLYFLEQIWLCSEKTNIPFEFLSYSINL